MPGLYIKESTSEIFTGGMNQRLLCFSKCWMWASKSQVADNLLMIQHTLECMNRKIHSEAV